MPDSDEQFSQLTLLLNGAALEYPPDKVKLNDDLDVPTSKEYRTIVYAKPGKTLNVTFSKAATKIKLSVKNIENVTVVGRPDAEVSAKAFGILQRF